jgi:biotin carboxylase
MMSRIAIINRGEAAMRLIHAVRELNAEGGEQIETGADAAWVGWGFVAEDPGFAELCERTALERGRGARHE